MRIMTQKQGPLKAIKMVKEKKTNVKKEFATERIYIRCTPTQKKIYMNYGGSALVIKMLNKMAEQIEQQKREQK